VRKVMQQNFFIRPTSIVARELLGKYLVCCADGKEVALMLNEIEMYDGFGDKASHAACGKTSRNEVMFGVGGHWYMYLIYGMYWMLNIVTGPNDYPAAILIRGAGQISGPGRLTKALGIDKRFNKKMALPEFGLWIEDRGVVVTKRQIAATPRIGVAYAGEVWSKKPYRLVFMPHRQAAQN